MIFVLDNYDSFTYNLVQYLGELGADPLVRRNDAVTVEDVMALSPSGVLVSPGPGVPAGAGISVALIRRCLTTRTPILGVCLGHQALAESEGGVIVRARRLMHGKPSPVEHANRGVFRDLPSPIQAMRYHSLLVDTASVPSSLEVTAWTQDWQNGQEIMGLEHRERPAWGVQFHPESVGTPLGIRMIENFLAELRRR